MSEIPQTQDEKPFGNWRIRLAVVLAIILLCMVVILHGTFYPNGTVLQERNVEAAWWALTVTMVALLGAALADERLTQYIASRRV